jgi:chloramphenicol-sensitive protein RarD
MKSTFGSLNGVIFGLGATLLWGSYPLWYKPLSHLDSYQLLAWRIIFAEAFLVVFILATRKLDAIVETVKTTRISDVFVIALVLGLWWLMYIYGVMSNRVLEVAFGYFLSPIVSMAFSRVVFREPWNFYQKAAFFCALCGVLVMAVHLLALRTFPWIAITIGLCYAFYGIFKKRIPGDPLLVQGLEIGLLLPLGISYLSFLEIDSARHIWGDAIQVDILLCSTGIITVLPLWWYSKAAKELSVKTLGFMQFVPPTCNFLLAIFIFHEAVTSSKIFSFVLIWIALAIYTANSMLASRK